MLCFASTVSWKLNWGNQVTARILQMFSRWNFWRWLTSRAQQSLLPNLKPFRFWKISSCSSCEWGEQRWCTFSIKQLRYLEATVLFFVEREIRQSVASTLYIICIIVLTLYTLLVLIETLMHKGDTLLEWWNTANVWWPFCWAGFLEQLPMSFSSDSQRSVWHFFFFLFFCFLLFVCFSVVLPVA